jgi:hypothetical protein
MQMRMPDLGIEEVRAVDMPALRGGEAHRPELERRGTTMAGVVILVDKVSPRCEECRSILRYGHMRSCSQYKADLEDMYREVMEEDRNNAYGVDV